MIIFDKAPFSALLNEIEETTNQYFIEYQIEHDIFVNAFEVIKDLTMYEQVKLEYLASYQADMRKDDLALTDEQIHKKINILKSLIGQLQNMCLTMGFYNRNKLSICFLGFYTSKYFVAGFQ